MDLRTHMDIASSPIEIVELSHTVSPSTVRYVLKDSAMVPESGLDLASNIFHALSPINSFFSTIISSSSTTNIHPMQI